jgi:hypothetical protein
LGPKRDANNITPLEKLEVDARKSSLLRKLMFGAGAVCLLAFYLTAPALLSVSGGPLGICYALYNILFAWIPSSVFSVGFVLFLPEFFNFLLNLKRGDIESAVCSFTARASIVNVIVSLITGGLFIPVRGNSIQNIVTEQLKSSATFKSMMDSGIPRLTIIDKVTEQTTSIVETINKYIASARESSAAFKSITDIVIKFKEIVVSFIEILGNNRIAVICSCLIALVVIYYLFYSDRVEQNNETIKSMKSERNISPEYVASCIEDLIAAQKIIVDFCNIVVEHSEDSKVELNNRVKDFKTSLKSLGKDCVEFKKYFDPDLFDGLDYLGTLENIHDNIERLMADLGVLISLLDVDTGKKDIFAGHAQNIYTHIKSKLMLKIAIIILK